MASKELCAGSDHCCLILLVSSHGVLSALRRIPKEKGALCLMKHSDAQGKETPAIVLNIIQEKCKSNLSQAIIADVWLARNSLDRR